MAEATPRMRVNVKIPLGLLKLTQDQRTVEVEAADVRQAIEALESLYPGVFRRRFYDEQGKLKETIRIFVNRKDIRGMQGDNTPLADGDEVVLLPAISGG